MDTVQELISKIKSLEYDRALLDSQALSLQTQQDKIHSEVSQCFQDLYSILIKYKDNNFAVGDQLITLNRNCGAESGRAIVISPLRSL